MYDSINTIIIRYIEGSAALALRGICDETSSDE